MLTFVEEGHKYFWDGELWPSVTQIMEEEGISNFSKVPAFRLEAAKAWGTAVHRMCQFWDEGALDESKLSEPLKPVLAGWQKFRKDYGFNFTLGDIERRVYSLKWKFAGTLDRIPAERPDLLLDIKTSEEIAWSVGAQVSAYSICLEETDKIKIKERWAVILPFEGGYKIEPFAVDERATFLAALTLNKRKKRG